MDRKDVWDINDPFYPFVQLTTQELIEQLPLKSINDVYLRPVEVYGYIYQQLESSTLGLTARDPVLVQIMKELHARLN